MKRFLVYGFIGLFAMVCWGSEAWAQGQIVLKAANYGGQFTASQNKYAAEVFTNRTKIKIQWIDGNPKDHLAKMIASKGREAPFDIVYLDDNVQADAMKLELIEHLDPNIVTNLKFIYPEAIQFKGYGPGMIFYSVGLSFNSKKFKELGLEEPTSWKDLWNPKLAGHVAVPHISTIAGQDFLIACALINGGTEKTIDKGFEMLAKLKVLYFFTSSADLRTKFLSGDTWAAPWYNGRAWGVIDEGFPMKFIHPKEKGFAHTTTIDVVKGTKFPKEAQMFLNTVLDPLAQLGQANEIPYGPTNRLLAPVLKEYPELAKKFPSSVADLKGLYVPDWNYVNGQYQEWVETWNKKITK
jgi:putative spermidine/putrescine transport system substrate-binding protein